MSPRVYSVFTKPWPEMPLPKLAAHVRALGFAGVELPVRPGFQVEPKAVQQELIKAVQVFAEEGVEIVSVAGPADELTMAACAEAGVSIIRVMASIDRGESYTTAESRLKAEYDRLLPLLEAYGVTLGVQNHCDHFVPNALGLRALIGTYDPQHVAAVWDAAHEALVGMPPEFALDVVWPQLCMVNLKNGFWQRSSGPEADVASWRHYWTGGPYGLADWPRVIAELKRREYDGVVCLTAEYSDRDSVDRLIAEDIAFAKMLFAREDS